MWQEYSFTDFLLLLKWTSIYWKNIWQDSALNQLNSNAGNTKYIFLCVWKSSNKKKIKGHDSSLSQSKKTRKCYIHIIVGLIYKEQTLNEVFWFNILWAAHLGPPGMGRTKSEDAVRSSLLYCLYPDAILCLLHFSGLELTCSEQKRPAREYTTIQRGPR